MMRTLGALRYLERNPVRADLVEHAEEAPRSSAAAHRGLTLDPVLEPLPDSALGVNNLRAWLAGDDAPEEMLLRRCTHSGIPCGSSEFLSTLSDQLGRPLVARPRGRPRKAFGLGQDGEDRGGK